MTHARKPVPFEAVNALIAAYDYALTVASAMHFDLYAPGDRFTTAYFSTSIELVTGCIVLAKANETIGIPILVRTLLEAYVDFHCVFADSQYSEYIEAAHDHEWAKVMDTALTGDSIYLGKLGEEPSA